MDPVIAKLVDLGIAGISLLGLWMMVRRMLDAQEQTNTVTIANLRADLVANRVEYHADVQRLVNRVSELEDRSHATQAEVLRSCVSALESNASALESNAYAFRKLTEDTGKHRARTT